MYLVYVHMSATVVATTSGWIKDPFLFVRVYCCAVGNKTLAPTVRQVGNKLKLFEEDESLISKPRRIFVVVLKAHQTKKVAQTFCAKQCKRKYQSITWKYELTFKQTTENSFLSDVENLAMFMFTELT